MTRTRAPWRVVVHRSLSRPCWVRVVAGPRVLGRSSPCEVMEPERAVVATPRQGSKGALGLAPPESKQRVPF